MRYPVSSLLLAACAVVLPLASLSATSVEPAELISPMTGRTFRAMVLSRAELNGSRAPDADMGKDADGCSHSTGLNEYDLLFIVDPTSYFTAQSVEWNTRQDEVAPGQPRGGRFLYRVTPELKEWTTKTFNGQWVIDQNAALRRAQELARQTGNPPPSPDTFVMEQSDIQTHVRFRNALLCYQFRGGNDLTYGKIANTGAWAMRVFLNRPFLLGNSKQMAGAYEEVNAKFEQLSGDKRSQSYDVAEVTRIYGEIRKKPLTNEAKLFADLTYFGLRLRDGDLAKVYAVLQEMKDDHIKKDENAKAIFPAIVREREGQLGHYLYFTRTAAEAFAGAVGKELSNRERLPTIIMSAAEHFRRCGEVLRSRDWFLALSRLPETQPILRAQIREQKKSPGVTAPPAVHLGWLADQRLSEYQAAGIPSSQEFVTQDKALLTEVVVRNLGHSTYQSPRWQPIKGGDARQTELIVGETGKAVLQVAHDVTWPTTLGELWDNGAVQYWDIFNRFCDPVLGKPLVYTKPLMPLRISGRDPRMVLLRTADKVPSPSGKPAYAMFLINGMVQWSETLVEPGDTLPLASVLK